MVWQEGLAIYNLYRNSGVVIILHEFFVFICEIKHCNNEYQKLDKVGFPVPTARGKRGIGSLAGFVTQSRAVVLRQPVTPQRRALHAAARRG